MITLATIEGLLVERRKELAVLRERHEVLIKRLQSELQAHQNAFQQLGGAIIELEKLKRLAGQGNRNGEGLKVPRVREVKRV
jgi:hypothetical protein